MSKVKFQNYSGIKNAKDNPRAIAVGDLKNGMAVVYSIGSDGKEYATAPTNATTAKLANHFVWNTIDKPELDNESDFVIKDGEFARIFEFPKGELLDMSDDLIATTVLVTGDILVADVVNGGYIKTADSAGYAFGLHVKEATTFGGKGHTVLVVPTEAE